MNHFACVEKLLSAFAHGGHPKTAMLHHRTIYIRTEIAFALVSEIKDIRALVTTSMSAGSITFVISALGNSVRKQ
jgi:hypothetical protein